MNVSAEKSLEVVEGEVVGKRTIILLGLLLMSVLFLPAGAWIAWAWWTGAAWNGRQFTFVAGLPGLVLLGTGLFGVPGCLYALWVGEKLILGKDCLQFATKRGRVITQIPYGNIDRMEFVKEPGKAGFVGIDVKELNDADTFNVGDAASKEWSGWHYRISEESWTMPLQQIYERLQKRLSFYQAADNS